ncbi:hypothetical protein [Sinorhizobium fredii]|uniref:hypothetical protein n=1 Tax=Rhizobium fredii TaxID=380 RepID=UPI002958570A|nr:hypothetical protein [Sinorhizobium fredii]WOS65002.1 hypothetical protein SFGR64A_25935 [Sinorhizobium fredii GR64]
MATPDGTARLCGAWADRLIQYTGRFSFIGTLTSMVARNAASGGPGPAPHPSSFFPLQPKGISIRSNWLPTPIQRQFVSILKESAQALELLEGWVTVLQIDDIYQAQMRYGYRRVHVPRSR